MDTTNAPRIAIIGAGFGGLATAFELTRSGNDNFVIFERAARVGGVWRENTYPGAGCDVPSPFYSFSYAPNPTWPHRFARQEAILEYIEECVERFGISDRLRLSTNVTDARFDEARNVWKLTTATGEQHEFDVLVCACGQLSDPAYPNIDGRAEFAGHSFHSAEWDHEHDLSGKRVAVIGTGASAIQFVPKVAEQAAEVQLYQRSAPWVIPKPDREFSSLHHRLFKRAPWLLGAERLGWYLFCEYGQTAVTSRPKFLAPWTFASRWFMRRQVRDAAKRRALTPDYQAGCKRLLFSNDYYAAMARDNVAIVSDDIAKITPDGVTTADGTTRTADTIIYATGFQAHGFVAPMTGSGCGGMRLAEDAWRDGPRAYLGITVTGFPNLFVLHGPNTSRGG